jgi:hypothetical protein
VIAEAGDDAAAQVRRAWSLAFGRPPSESDVAEAVAYLTAQRAHFAAQPAGMQPPQQQALTTFCQALFCSNEFLYVD